MASFTVINNSGKPLAGVLVRANSRLPGFVQKGQTDQKGRISFEDVAARTYVSVRDHIGQSWRLLNQEFRSLRGNLELTY